MQNPNLQDIQSVLTVLDNTLGDARKAESQLPGTKNILIMAALKELSSGLGRAIQATTKLQILAQKESKW